MRINKLVSAVIATSTMIIPINASAQEAKSAIELEIEQLKLEVELQKQKNELTKTELERIKTLGLPSFEGKTETDANTGKFEATIMAATAMQTVAQQMAAKILPGAGAEKILVLAGDEQFQFGFSAQMKFEMNRIRSDFLQNCPKCKPVQVPFDGPAEVAAASAVAIISAVAGLIRSDVKLTTVTIDKIDSKFLAATIAANLKGQGFLYGGHQGIVINQPSQADIAKLSDEPAWQSASVDQRYFWLTEAANLLKIRVAALSITSKLKKVNAKELAKLASLTTRYTEFADKIVKLDTNGITPLAVAIKDEKISSDLKYVVRVYVRDVGGSTKVTKNIATFLGRDPLRVTGGLIASYSLFDPFTGLIPLSDTTPIWVCTTGYKRLRYLNPSSIKPDCSPKIP